MAEIHPDMRDLLAAKDAVTKTGDAAILRKDWDAYGKRLSRPYPADLAVEDQTFNCPGAGRDGAIKVRIYRPKAAPKRSPCVIFLHGGGWIKGSLDSADSNAWGVADETGAVVISVDYRLAPDFPYPAALTDAYEVLRYVAAKADVVGIDKARIGLWGESAGANLVAGVAIMARDKKGPSISAQVMIYGPFSDDRTLESYRVYADTLPGATTADVHKMWAHYTRGKSGDDLLYATPAKIKDLKGLPPAFIHYAEIDPCADDSPLYAGRLTEAGVPTTLRCAKGMIHGFIRARFSGSAAANEFALPCMYLRGIFAAAGRGV
jgi:acetyl esterase